MWRVRNIGISVSGVAFLFYEDIYLDCLISFSFYRFCLMLYTIWIAYIPFTYSYHSMHSFMLCCAAVYLCLFLFLSCLAPKPGNGIYGWLSSFGCGFMRLCYFLFFIYLSSFVLRDDGLIPVVKRGCWSVNSIEETISRML